MFQGVATERLPVGDRAGCTQDAELDAVVVAGRQANERQPALVADGVAEFPGASRVMSLGLVGYPSSLSFALRIDQN